MVEIPPEDRDQLEQDLQGLLAAIKAHPNYDTISGRALGEFWDPTWTPAPFEELLTIRQLTSFDITTLFKKKAVTESRTVNVYQALQRIFDALVEGPTSSPKKREKPEQKAHLNSSGQLAGCDELTVFSAPARAVHEVLTRVRTEQRDDDLTRLAEDFLAECSADECVEVILGKQLAPELARRISQLVQNTVPQPMLSMIQRLLEGPAVRIDYVARVLRSSKVQPDALIVCLATLVARALGAAEVVYQGTVCTGFWTLNSTLLQSLHGQLIRKSPRKGGDSASQREQVSLDPFLLNHLKDVPQSQGRPQSQRQGKGKRLKSRRRSKY